MSHVRNFVGQHLEVFINLMSSFVNRFLSQNPCDLPALYGINIPDHLSKEDIVAEYVKNFVREGEGDDLSNYVRTYEKALREETGANFVLEFEMRNKSNDHLYHLIFVTNHIKV